MDRLTECEELLDRCAEVARDVLGLGDVLTVAVVSGLLIALWSVLRRVSGQVDVDPPAVRSQYEERVQYLQALKSGRLWGDIGMIEPEEVLPPPTGVSPAS